MMVCHTFPFEISGRFIGTTGTIGSGSGSGSDSTITFGILDTFLFRTTGSSVLVAFSNWNLLCRL